MWDARDGTQLAEFFTWAPVASVEFKGDPTQVITASDNGTARIFSRATCCALPELLDLARDRVTRDLTAEERAEFL